jgi:transposase
MQVYGIDLSKEKFDVNFIDAKGKEKKQEVKNAVASISRFLSSVSGDGILCAEHTGAYGDLLVYLCNQMKVPIALVPGYTIKHSLGLVKGKSDPLDSRRIREYGERFSDKLEYAEYAEENIAELKQLYTLRNQLVKQRRALRTVDTGRGHLPMQSISVHKHINTVLDGLDKEITDIEEGIEMLIRKDQEMNENFELITGIIGIGPVIATDLIIKTGNFRIIDTHRRAASYAGVCPFPNASGKMVGKSRTSPFADKKLKSLLYMGARAAVKHNKEYKLYYQKKELEGKPYFLIMNNVSNKLLRTVYSVVRNKTPYVRDHVCLDPRERNINSSTKKVA